ncbi:thymidine phosphorylase [candidate division KSB1 bacterium]|nr:thymidine phosphorylase [candidate division KSB1 bacterium]
MNALQLITKKQAGNELTPDEISYLVRGYVNGDIPDYQMSAFLMAAYYQEMSPEETYQLTKIMLESGERVNTSSIPGIKVDKHSTGGVGDKVSIVLAPLIACVGLYVPMISGRALGHSGGTLDKLESIPGINTNLSVDEAVKQLSKIGAVFMAQTEELVPADKKMYALRDATSTVKSIPLITASILSKKIAEGIDGLVLDVKVGKGAFYSRQQYALKLANSLINVSEKFGLKTSVLFTAMDQPLGKAVGNWLEIKESIDTLRGNGPKDFVDVVLALGSEMLVQTKQEKTYEEALKRLSIKLQSGEAYKKLLEIVKSQGGKTKFIENPGNYPESQRKIVVRSERSGYISTIDALQIGTLAMDVGAGRHKMTDEVDLKAGVMLNKKVGDYVERGEELATIMTDRQIEVTEINTRVWNAIEVTKLKVLPPNPLLGYAVKDGSCRWPPF